MRPSLTSGVGWIPLGLAVITLGTLAPSLWNGFVEWDDYSLLLRNAEYRGLSWTHLRWMFTTVLLGHYAPLTWLSFGLDYVVWGTRPFGYHLTNLLLHTANAVLFYLVAGRLFERATSLEAPAGPLAAATAALFFAIHPLRVESVSWATGRRDVLSGLFFLLAVLLYLTASGTAGRRRRWLLTASVGAYGFAVASKAIVMTLPLLLVLLDVYPLRRLPGDPRRWWAPSARGVWLEKAPYLLLGLFAGAMAHSAASTMGVTVLETYPWLGKVFRGLWFYVHKTLLPAGLSPLYEFPARTHPLEPRVWVSAVGVICVTVAVLLLRRAWPAGLAVWLSYGIALAPVTARTHAGPQLMADRYSYLACLGFALVVGAGAGVAAQAATRRILPTLLARLIAGSALVWFLGLGALTWHQTQVWRDTESLWRHAIRVTPECATCHNNLASVLLDKNAPAAALEHFRRALNVRPDIIQLHGNVGLALAKLGRLPEAIEQYQRVLEQAPGALFVRINLATALMALARRTEAVEQLEEAVRSWPASSAAGEFKRAVGYWPDAAIPRLGLVRVYLALGSRDLARAHYDVLRRLDPTLAALVGDAFASGQ